MTLDQARFAVKVMDSIMHDPSQMDDDVIPENAKVRILYRKYGRYSEGAERGRAEWLIEYIQKCAEQGKGGDHA